MATSYKPNGYNNVSPYFIVEEPQQFMHLLEEIFGAKELRKYSREDGSILHAEMKIGDSVLMIGGANEQYPAIEQLVHVYVENVDEVFKKAIEAGCDAVEKPKTQENDPDKRGSFTDFAGNFWSIGTQISEE